MKSKKTYVFLMSGFVVGVLVVVYVFSLQAQLREVRANQQNYEKAMDSLSSVESSDALEVNQEFLNHFFTYETPNDRYKNIQTYMTDQGFQATHPSGTELPKSEESVTSTMSGLKAYEFDFSKTEAAFLNEFQLSTDFNDVTNTETVIVKTSLVYVKEQGWKVDDVEFVGQLTGR
ncbi:hypothetical protein [Bacillus sp. RAR_GA_16]|uniref:hypothetical protein n=1 Tax=Bacillus sp. RAR_GA_16 TaxID=2876774 RepID=UPI001CC9EF12|nr:hypothetical protein [Bacillus sp. RAR_GA_16]MCA0174615.1 hypothetical protein [Bacillus sp. RAR_GA_16]